MFPYILVAVLLVVLLAFGVNGAMSSYAEAQQTQAVIEVARVGQINAFGNLAVILFGIFVVLAVIGALGLMVWLNLRKTASKRAQPSAPDINALVQLQMLKALQQMSAAPRRAQLPVPAEMPVEQWEDEIIIPWMEQ